MPRLAMMFGRKVVVIGPCAGWPEGWTRVALVEDRPTPHDQTANRRVLRVWHTYLLPIN